MAAEIVPWVIAINALLSIAALLHSWLSSSGTKAMKRVDQLDAIVKEMREEWEEKADARYAEFRGDLKSIFTEIKETNAMASARSSMIEQQTAVLTSRFEAMPSRETTQRLEVSLARVEGQIETLAERIRPVAAMASRLQEHAMEDPRR